MTPSKSLPARPSLESLRKQAKKLARDIAAGDTRAIARARAQLPNVDVPLSQRNAPRYGAYANPPESRGSMTRSSCGASCASVAIASFGLCWTTTTAVTAIATTAAAASHRSEEHTSELQ